MSIVLYDYFNVHLDFFFPYWTSCIIPASHDVKPQIFDQPHQPSTRVSDNDTAGWKACFQVSASTVQSHDTDSITTEEDTDIYIFYENISIDESRCKQMQGS